MATAYIIKTADGQMQINYSDGSVQTGTEDQLRATLARNLPNYDIQIFNSKKTAAENADAHANKYGGYDKIGNYGKVQQEFMSTYQAPKDTYSWVGSSSNSGYASSADAYDANVANNQLKQALGIGSSGSNQGSGWQNQLKDKVYKALQSGASLDPSDWKVTGSRNNYYLQIGNESIKIDSLVKYDDEGPRIQNIMNSVKNYNQAMSNVKLASPKESVSKLIASYEHFKATGKDDGGGFINKQTGLPQGAKNEAEAYLIRTGNFKMSKEMMLGILDKASDGLKQSLSKGLYGTAEMSLTRLASIGKTDKAAADYVWSQTRDRVADNLLNGVLGSSADNRDFGKLMAVAIGGADAFVNALSVANTQNYTVGDPIFNPETGEFEGYSRDDLSFGMVNGQPMMTGVAGNSALSKQILDGLWVSPEQIQGIVQGDVYSNYQKYYDTYRKNYEFLNDFDFLNLKGLDNKIINKVSDTSGLSAIPGSGGVGSGGTGGTGTGGTGGTGTGSTQTFGTSTFAPVTYETTDYTQTFDTSDPSLAGLTTGTYPQAPATGTFNTPTQTAGLSAVPQTITTKTDYTGTNMANLTSPSQGVGGVEQVTYRNPLTQQEIRMTEINGSPIGVIPPGFQKVTAAARGAYINGYADGGITDVELEGKYRIYTKQFGYTGPKTREAMKQFEDARPEVKRKGMAIGGYVRKFNNGGVVRGFVDGGLTREQLANMQASAVTQTMQPIQSNVQMLVPQEADFISSDAGQAYAVAPFAEAATVPSTAQAGMPMTAPAATMGTVVSSPAVQAETEALQAATGTLSDQAQVTAAQQGTSAVSDLKAEQGTAIMMDNPVQREIQDGELISGVANAQKAAEFTEQIEAATATPSKQATVQGQLEGLMQQFEGGETPSWAAGSMRTAMATLSARGLGASSMAGQAVIQAAMEAALPIAQMDAQTQAQFEAQNLSNRQQRAMLAAQQRATFLGQEFDQAFQARVANASRVADIANMNFTAEQQIALENARAANTMELNNLSNRQAVVMAEAAALSQLDMANLNNRQQAAVQNAQNFLQMDMTNLANEQQTAIFKSQQNIQALFTDQASMNAAAQFNATSENQTNQFFASLTSQVSQFNATQQNAMDQFNVNSVNALREFNSELQQQRDLFNAQNGLVIAQANAQWRQNIATMNTAALNESNMEYAKTINALTASNMDQIWQRERDIMSFAFAAAESAADRASNIAIAKLTAAEQTKLQDSIGQGKLAAIAFDVVLKKWLG